MAKVECNSILVTSTGGKTPVLDDFTLDIDRLVLFAVFSDGTVAAGYYDASKKFTGSSTYKDENVNYPLTHYRNISGIKTKVCEISVTNLDVGEFSINVSTLSNGSVTLYYAAYED